MTQLHRYPGLLQQVASRPVAPHVQGCCQCHKTVPTASGQVLDPETGGPRLSPRPGQASWAVSPVTSGTTTRRLSPGPGSPACAAAVGHQETLLWRRPPRQGFPDLQDPAGQGISGSGP